MNELKNITQHVKNGLSGLPLFATIGNHDAYPQDMIQANPQYNEAIKEWSPSWDSFFTSSEQKKTFDTFGSYSAPLKFKDGTEPKVETKIISLNTVFCYSNNYENMA